MANNIFGGTLYFVVKNNKGLLLGVVWAFSLIIVRILSGAVVKIFGLWVLKKNKDVNLSKTKFWARLLKNSLDTKFLVENHEGISFLRVGGQNYFIGRGGNSH